MSQVKSGRDEGGRTVQRHQETVSVMWPTKIMRWNEQNVNLRYGEEGRV